MKKLLILLLAFTCQMLNAQSLSVSTSVLSNVSCPGGNNGSASGNPSGGTSPYTYLWAPTSQTTQVASGLVAGTTYSLSLHDNAGHSASAIAIVTQPATLSISTHASSSLFCSGSSDSLFSSTTGGTPPYTYAWIPASSLSCTTCQNPVASPSGTTTYTLALTDNKGCTASATDHITLDLLANNTFSTAIMLPLGNSATDQGFDACQNTLWYAFFADSTNMTIGIGGPIMAADSGLGTYIKSYTVYQNSMGTLTQLAYDSLSMGTDSIPNIEMALTRGQTYYIKVKKYTTSGCVPCSRATGYFSIAILGGANSFVVVPCDLEPCGSNMLCNGSFETVPAWAHTCGYQVNSPAQTLTTPFWVADGSPISGNCVKSDVRFANTTPDATLEGLNADNEFTDLYVVGEGCAFGPGNGWQMTPESGSYMMGVDCPSDGCTPCGYGKGLYTPNDEVMAWEQNITVTSGKTYIFSMYIEDLDISSKNPGADVGVSINGQTQFYDVIKQPTYTNWKFVSFCWTASSTNADIQIWGQGAPRISNQITPDSLGSSTGYDFGLDNLSFTAAASTHTISIAASPSSPVCAGSPVTLSVTSPDPDDNYTWSTGQTGTSITVYPTDCNPYTVTANNLCSGSTSYTPTVLSTSISGPNTVCEGTIINEGGCSVYSLTFTPSVSYCGGGGCSPTNTWSTNPTSSANACSSNSLQLITNGDGTVTVLIPIGDNVDIGAGFTVTLEACCGDLCCSSTYTVSGCCIGGGSDAIINGKYLSDFDNGNLPFPYTNESTTGYDYYTYFVPSQWTVTETPGNWTFNGLNGLYPILINDYLEVNENLTIENSDVFLGPNAKIVLDGGSLTLNCCRLHACSAMWDGIYAYDGGSITIDNCLIEDAKSAVVSNSSTSSTITISGSDINKNYVGVDIENYAGTYPLYISNTTFSCNEGYFTFPCSMSLGSTTTLDADGPYAGKKSFIGVLANGVNSITVGTAGSTSLENTFEYLYYGIYTKNSSTNVYNNVFEDIDYGGGFTNYGLQGAGVMALGNASGTSTVVVGGNAGTEPNSFSYSPNGIFARDTVNVNIRNDAFNTTSCGVKLENNFGRSLVVGNATYYNSFTNVTTGIYAYNNPHSSLGANWNHISSSVYGIEVDEIGYNNMISSVSDNTISSTSIGIAGYFYANGTIESNVVTIIPICGSCSLSYIDAIYLSPAKLNVVYNNTANCNSQQGEGIRIQAPVSYGNRVTCNTINYGIHSFTFTGSQNIPGSTFFDYNVMTNYGSVSSGCGLYLNSNGDIGMQGIPSNGTSNEFNTCAHYAYYSQNPVGTTQFYIYSPLMSNCIYNPTDYLLGTLIPFSSSTGVDCYVCSGSSPCGGGGGGGGNSNLSLYEAIASEGFAAATGAYPTQTLWDKKHDLYDGLKLGEASYLDSSFAVARFYDSVATSNLGYLQSIAGVLADTNGISSTDIGSAVLDYSYITSPDTSEYIAQDVYSIVINMVENGQGIVDSTQEVYLQTIAPLCPFQYGYGVYMARALLSPVDTNMYISSCEYESDTANHTEGYHKPVKSNLRASVYPNPASSELNIQIFALSDTGQSGAGRVEYFYLYNALGQLIDKATLTNDLTTLPLSDVAVGIYYYRVVDNNQNPIRTDKLLIVR